MRVGRERETEVTMAIPTLTKYTTSRNVYSTTQAVVILEDDGGQRGCARFWMDVNRGPRFVDGGVAVSVPAQSDGFECGEEGDAAANN
jgi:hypothetical protein